MYTCINGWTKERMKEAIRKGNNGTRATNPLGECVYLTPEGNKCAVGCFIPDGHPGQKVRGTVRKLLGEHPDLEHLIPLPESVIRRLQFGHDNHSEQGDVRDTLCDWIDANVMDSVP